MEYDFFAYFVYEMENPLKQFLLLNMIRRWTRFSVCFLSFLPLGTYFYLEHVNLF